MVAGIVLAAGMSTRMGQLKQLLPFGGQPAIRWIVDVLEKKLEHIVVVLGHRADDIMPTLVGSRAHCIINSTYRLGMLSSVQSGLQALNDTEDYMIFLGDQPRLDQGVIEQILVASEQTDHGIFIPTYNEKRGHPILIRNRYRSKILALPLEMGLNSVTGGHPEDTCEVAVTKAGILDDMDTPADYQRELDLWQQE